MTRLSDAFAKGRPALVTYFMGGDPDYASSMEIMKALPIGSAEDVAQAQLAVDTAKADHLEARATEEEVKAMIAEVRNRTAIAANAKG